MSSKAFGIATTFNLCQCRVVARVLRKRGQCPLEPPCQRVEPEDGRVETGDHSDERIPPSRMRVLVRQHRGQHVGRPLAPPDGQNDSRRQQTNRDRR
jgi:hypothetical protein